MLADDYQSLALVLPQNWFLHIARHNGPKRAKKTRPGQISRTVDEPVPRKGDGVPHF